VNAAVPIANAGLADFLDASYAAKILWGNPADPDASFNAHKGHGYIAQIVETYCEDGDKDREDGTAAAPKLITHVAVHKMTVHDGHRLPSPTF
jgi:hypothetical protein